MCVRERESGKKKRKGFQQKAMLDFDKSGEKVFFLLVLCHTFSSLVPSVLPAESCYFLLVRATRRQSTTSL